MRVSRFVLAFAAGLVAAGLVAACVGAGEADEALARSAADGAALYARGKGTPAQFITDQRGRLDRDGEVFRGELPGDRAAATRKLADLMRNAEMGFAWREPPAAFSIPRLAAAPVADGRIGEAEWRGALTLSGEFILGATERAADRETTRWRFGWHGATLYVAASFRDGEIRAVDNAPPERDLHRGDVFEWFIRPREDWRLYYEFLVNPDGAWWGLIHTNNPWGGFLSAGAIDSEAVRAGAERTADGYAVEFALPMDEMLSDWNKRPAAVGDTFRFMAVRIDHSTRGVVKSAPAPFLYDGHNIFGHARATLAD